jgi:GT2 family glycosyltransferase
VTRQRDDLAEVVADQEQRITELTRADNAVKDELVRAAARTSVVEAELEAARREAAAWARTAESAIERAALLDAQLTASDTVVARLRRDLIELPETTSTVPPPFGIHEVEERLEAYGHALREQIESSLLERMHAQTQHALESNASSSAAAAAARDDDHQASRLRALVVRSTPDDAHVLVVTSGDERLLAHGRRGGHFPPQSHGGDALETTAPTCATSIIAQLEVSRSGGATHIAFPASTLWWLDFYPDLARHLSRVGRQIADEESVGVLFALDRGNDGAGLVDAVLEVDERTGRRPAILDWTTDGKVADALPEHATFRPPAKAEVLPYLDHSVDVVVVDAGTRARLAEARRVASDAVVELAADGTAHVQSTATAKWQPTVSIIIPCYDGAATTDACLDAVARTLPPSFSGEVLVIDDASTDGTATMLKGWAKRESRVRVIRNRTNAGFIASCNRAAKAANGDILVFLNNDTIPLPGWLPPLLSLLDERPDAGAVGGRLVYGDGTLQEAGAVLFSDGSGANFGRHDANPDASLYSFVREVDYCSGALLATRRDTFLDAGGFDVDLRPAYYEDSDYCLTLRAKGLRTYYQPESTVVHLEGVSNGTDTSGGLKRYQAVNREKFVGKWREFLATRPLAPDRYDITTWLALAATHEED